MSLSNTPLALATLFTIWQTDNSQCSIDPEDAPLVDRACKEWAEKRRDTWLSLSTADGAPFSVLASTITSTLLSTPEQRSAGVLREKAIEDERADNRRAAGYIETE